MSLPLARLVFSVALFGVGIVLGPPVASAQMVTAGFPLRGVRSSFFEGFSVNGGFCGSGVTSPFNRFGPSLPGPGLSGGFGLNGGGFGARLGFNFAQGSSRSFTSSTPVVTGFSGLPLAFRNSLQRPFVTSLVPVVGSGGAFQNLGAANTIRGRMRRGEFAMQNGQVVPAGGARPKPRETPKRIANRRPLVDAAPPTRAERQTMREEQQAARALAIREYLKKGRKAEAEGKASVAKLYYQMAARRASGELKREAVASLNRLAGEPN